MLNRFKGTTESIIDYGMSFHVRVLILLFEIQCDKLLLTI